MDRIRSVTPPPDRSDPSKAWIKVKDLKHSLQLALWMGRLNLLLMCLSVVHCVLGCCEQSIAESE